MVTFTQPKNKFQYSKNPPNVKVFFRKALVHKGQEIFPEFFFTPRRKERKDRKKKPIKFFLPGCLVAFTFLFSRQDAKNAKTVKKTVIKPFSAWRFGGLDGFYVFFFSRGNAKKAFERI
jgi:hypothetical protein